MKKISIILTILLSTFFIGSVKAASARITISPASKTILVGNTITLNVNISATEDIATYEYTLVCNSDLLSLQSSTTEGEHNVGSTTGKATSLSFSYTYRAKASGNVTCRISGGAVTTADEIPTYMSISTGTASIKIMTQRELEATYSSNNNLSGLSIDGYDLTPAFDKNTLEYTVKLKPETETVTINASKEDYTATINGIGTIAVSEGTNVIKIDVVAQNGNIKSYTINAIVEEYDPINVSVDNEAYTVVRSKKAQTFSNNLFVERTIQIGEYEVPSYYNELTKNTLVALKDSNGEINYFLYNDNKYTKFNELKLNSIDLMLLEPTDVPEGYIKDTVKINDIDYPVYRMSNSRFLLIYGVNLVNNNKGFYVYDNYENTLQRYDSSVIDELNSKIDRMTYIVYVLGTSTLVFVILLFISLYIRSNKQNKEDKITEINDMAALEETKDENNMKKIEEIMDSVDNTKEIKEIKKTKKKTKK